MSKINSQQSDIPEAADAAESQTVKTAEKPAPEGYTGRSIRTLVAVFAGLIAAVICFLSEMAATETGGSRSTIYALLVLVACILIQKHVFMLLRLHPERLQKKDWFYQAFMTFAFWFISWTILLTATMENSA